MFNFSKTNLSRAVNYIVGSFRQTIASPAAPHISISPTNKSHRLPLIDVNCGNSHSKVTSRIGHSIQVRFCCQTPHNDWERPNFDRYRRDSLKNPNTNTQKSNDSRANFTYLILMGGALGAVYSSKAIVTHYISFMAASAEVLALAQIEIKLAEIPLGKQVTFKWRGKPLFIWHRTPELIQEVREVPINTLRDPESDEDRTQKAEWLVIIGVCTHLGCVPIANAGDYNGYYCPCHGSHFDASGRIRKGPAPTNLEVPLYSFPTETSLVVG